jgi:protein-S-isoprenylcysteine O-methyltransferase Ste14
VSLLAKNLAVNLVYYAVTAAALPAAVLFLEQPLPPPPILCAGGAAAILAGAALQLWCIVVFHRRGRGTPTPSLPPVELVTSGPYARIRNPMNAGEVLLFAGLAAWFGSIGLVIYATVSWLAFHLFITRYEEPHLARAFGARYEEYRAHTGRWWFFPGD